MKALNFEIFGIWDIVFGVWDYGPDQLDDDANNFQRQAHPHGFVSMAETFKAMDQKRNGR